MFNLPGEVARRRHENLALCRNAGGSWPWPWQKRGEASRLRVDVLSTEARIFQKKKIEEGDSKKKKRFITLLEVFNLPLNIYLATEQKKKKLAGLLGQK